ncbi:hypothetical protein EVG20_g8921 [Dentipellis fragilis]|uniref:Uncharacterized protein n=1 Tax=Dentipellis fragilis TaxID=205917 RepID=A0A4Y9Y4D0_9AGAM|nr:hypothetical protein EVG20_g8921 [Dentipellis fragilis]
MSRLPKRFSSAPPAVAPHTRKRKNVPHVVEEIEEPSRIRRRIDDAAQPAVNPTSTGLPLNSISDPSIASARPGQGEAVQTPATVPQWVPVRPSTPESTLPPRLRRSAGRAAIPLRPESPRPMIRLRTTARAQAVSSTPRAASPPQAATPPPAANEETARIPGAVVISKPKPKVILRVVTNPQSACTGVQRTARRTRRFNPIGNVAEARSRATRYDPVRNTAEAQRQLSASPAVPVISSPAPAFPTHASPAPAPPAPAPPSPPPPTVPAPSPPTVPSPRRTPTLPPVPLPPMPSPTITGPLFLSPMTFTSSLGLSLITAGLSPPPVQLPELFQDTVKEETLATPPVSPLHFPYGELEQGNYVFDNGEEEQLRSPSPPPGYEPQDDEETTHPEGDAYGKASYMGDWPSDRGL